MDHTLLHKISDHAGQADSTPVWPKESWEILKHTSILKLSIPEKYGGAGSDTATLLQAYESLAGACLTTCFILTQRDAACRRILGSQNEQLCQELLPGLARGTEFATVGLSQLTTSRQHGKATFIATEDDQAIYLHGVIPWVTGASQAKNIVVGASLEDNRQLLVVLPTETPGVTIAPPMELMALQGSLTTEIHCDNVRVDRRLLLAGPEEKVMQGRRGGAGGLQTSCLALGLAGAAISYLIGEAETRPGLKEGVDRFASTRQQLRNRMYDYAQKEPTAEELTNLRAQANTLVVQVTQAALIAGKGTGFMRSHPAQRWVRQAMFFLVWSCPWPAASATLDYLTLRQDQECS